MNEQKTENEFNGTFPSPLDNIVFKLTPTEGVVRIKALVRFKNTTF